jgi:hypothetical protein
MEETLFTATGFLKMICYRNYGNYHKNMFEDMPIHFLCTFREISLQSPKWLYFAQNPCCEIYEFVLTCLEMTCQKLPLETLCYRKSSSKGAIIFLKMTVCCRISVPIMKSIPQRIIVRQSKLLIQATTKSIGNSS